MIDEIDIEKTSTEREDAEDPAQGPDPEIGDIVDLGHVQGTDIIDQNLGLYK